MRKIIPILFLLYFFFNSCQYFDQQIPSEKKVMERELKAINWNEVDEFPSVNSCDSILGKQEKKQCFFDFLAQLIQEKLSIDTLTLIYPELDTIDVKVTILPNATMKFETQLNDSISYNQKTIDSIIKIRLVNFPQIHPATKRGIPVTTQFILPVILNVQ